MIGISTFRIAYEEQLECKSGASSRGSTSSSSVDYAVRKLVVDTLGLATNATAPQEFFADFILDLMTA